MTSSVRYCLSLWLLTTISACSALVDVNAPDIVQPTALASPAGAEVLRVGAISSFALAFAGSDRGQITTSGTIADEFHGAASAAVPIQAADQRIVPDPGPIYPYAEVQRARLDAERAIAAMQSYVPLGRSKIGELFALVGYTELFLGENMCSGIPMGNIVAGEPNYGQPLATGEIFARAIAHFDSALAYATDSVRILNFARIGQGRALLDAGRSADAASAIIGVPTAYAYVTYHAASQPNGVFGITNNSRFITVADRDGGNGLNFRSAVDPRVQTTLIGKGVDGVTDVYAFTRYNSLAAPITLASGIEARLIEAEATLRNADPSGALSILNALRASIPGLAPLAAETTETGQIDQLFRERAFWLFATGHRHGDLRRLVRQYSRPTESVFPTGQYKPGQAYGADVTFAPDVTQFANPSYVGCENRAP